MTLIKDYTGKEVEKSKCVKIGNEYYVKNQGVVKLYNDNSGPWVRITNSWVGYDYTNKCFIDKRKLGGDYVQGIVQCANSKPVRAYFLLNRFTTIKVVNSMEGNNENWEYCVDEETAKELGYVYSKRSPFYYHSMIVKERPDLIERYDPIKHSVNYGNREQAERSSYSVTDDPVRFNKMNLLHHNNYIPITGIMSKIDRSLFRDYSFGIEFELGNHILHPDLIGGTFLRDGSVKLEKDGANGFELASCILNGGKGLQSVYNFCKLNSDRGYFNSTMGMHIHLSNPKFVDSYGRAKKGFIVAMYKLYVLLQEELEELINISRRNNDYCKRLPSLGLFKGFDSLSNELLNNQFDFIWRHYGKIKGSENDIVSSYKGQFSWDQQVLLKDGRHIRVNQPWGRSKWNSLNRYSNLNLSPMFWGPRTVEYRIWNPTLNPQKVLSELCLSVAIAEFAYNNIELLLEAKDTTKITLNNVIESSVKYKKLQKYLIEFVRQQKLYYKDEKMVTIIHEKSKRSNYKSYEEDNTWSLKDYTNIFEDEVISIDKSSVL